MKKVFSLLLVFMISITLVGCGETLTEEKVIDYIEVNQSTIDESYTIDDFTLEGIEIYLYYTDETFERISLNENMISSSDLSKLTK